MFQLVDMTQLLDEITQILNIKLLMMCTTINKFVLYKNLITNLFRDLHIYEKLIIYLKFKLIFIIINI